MDNIGHRMIFGPEERAARRRDYSNRINSLKKPSARNPDKSMVFRKNALIKKDVSGRITKLDKKESKNIFPGPGDQSVCDMTNTISKRDGKSLKNPGKSSKNNYNQITKNINKKKFSGVPHKSTSNSADGTSSKRANKKFNMANTLNRNIRTQSNRNTKLMNVENKKAIILDDDIDTGSNQNLVNDLYSDASKEMARNRTTFIDDQYDDEENDRKIVNDNQDLIRDLYAKAGKDLELNSDIYTDDSYDDEEIFVTDNDRRLVDDLLAANTESKDLDDIEKRIDDVLSNNRNDEDDEVIENDLKKNQNLVEDFYARNDEDDGQNK